MNEYASLREDMARLAKGLEHYSDTAVRHLLEQSTQIDRLWADNAALRDDLHALANRVETLTRARLTEPAEVAGRIVSARAVPSGDDRLVMGTHRSVYGFTTEWRECECGAAIYTGDDRLIHDADGLHTCRASA